MRTGWVQSAGGGQTGTQAGEPWAKRSRGCGSQRVFWHVSAQPAGEVGGPASQRPEPAAGDPDLAGATGL